LYRARYLLPLYGGAAIAANHVATRPHGLVPANSIQKRIQAVPIFFITITTTNSANTRDTQPIKAEKASFLGN
jgi:hypothetical protein